MAGLGGLRGGTPVGAGGANEGGVGVGRRRILDMRLGGAEGEHWKQSCGGGGGEGAPSYAAKPPLSPPPPPGWIRTLSEEHNRYFYHHLETGESHWTPVLKGTGPTRHKSAAETQQAGPGWAAGGGEGVRGSDDREHTSGTLPHDAESVDVGGTDHTAETRRSGQGRGITAEHVLSRHLDEPDLTAVGSLAAVGSMLSPGGLSDLSDCVSRPLPFRSSGP